MKNSRTPAISKEVLHPSLHLSIIVKGHYPSHKVLLCVIFTKVYIYISLYIAIYNNHTYSAEMKERCRDGCRTSLLIAGVVLVPAIFHTLLPHCHPYITTHFMEMIFSTCMDIEHTYSLPPHTQAHTLTSIFIITR